MSVHNLYETGDSDAPRSIKDRNGAVVLELCRTCGQAEIDLDNDCFDPTDMIVVLKTFVISMPWDKGWGGKQIVAETASKAKYKYWLEQEVKDFHGLDFFEFLKVQTTISLGDFK